MWRNVILYAFDFHCTDVFCTLSRLFAVLSFALCSFGCSFFSVHLVLGSLTSKLHMTAISMSDCVVCVIILCSFLSRSLLNNNVKLAHSAYDAVLHTLFGISMTVIYKLSESKLLEDSYVEYKMSSTC